MSDVDKEKVAGTKGQLTWLHLSDLHVNHLNNSWDFDFVLKKLLNDLQYLKELNNGGLVPDFICFSGDIAWGEHKDEDKGYLEKQYQIAAKIIDKIRNVYDPVIPKDRIFITPGNHDVNRIMIADSQTDYIHSITKANKVHEMLENNDCECKRIMERFNYFVEFLKANGYKHLLGNHNHLFTDHHIKISEIDIGVACLNSAWSCSGEDYGKLWLGLEYQTTKILNKWNEKEIQIKIAIAHHPESCCVPEERGREWRIRINDNFHFFLHGHTHDPVVATLSGHTIISAGACYVREKEYTGYNIVKLDLQKSQGQVWLRQFDNNSSSWGPCKNNDTDDQGIQAIPLTCLSNDDLKLSTPQTNFNHGPSQIPMDTHARSEKICKLISSTKNTKTNSKITKEICTLLLIMKDNEREDFARRLRQSIEGIK